MRVAADIAKKQDACIELLHAYERPSYGMSLQFGVDNDQHREVLKTIEKEMERMLALDFMQGIDVSRVIEADKSVWEVLHESRFSNADLVVMGSHGASGLKEFFVGSNTEKVVRMTSIPVLVIKERIDKFEVKDLLFASNFREEADYTFGKIKKLAKLFGSHIQLLRVNTRDNFNPTKDSLKLMEDFADRMKLEDYSINLYDDLSVGGGVVNFSEIHNPDLVVMETHGRTGLMHMLSGSITENVVNHISQPILSLKIEKGATNNIERNNRPALDAQIPKNLPDSL
jgi:nucleotide-binding universal stress UspA family protein